AAVGADPLVLDAPGEPPRAGPARDRHLDLSRGPRALAVRLLSAPEPVPAAEVGRAGQDRRPERGLRVARLGRQCGRGLVLGRDMGLGAQRPAVLRTRRRPFSVNRYFFFSSSIRELKTILPSAFIQSISTV